MVIGAYRPRWVRSRAGARTLTALAFIIDRRNPHYAGRRTIAQQAKVLACAEGAFGSSADYLEHARIALITHGIVDPYLEALAIKVAAHRREVGFGRHSRASGNPCACDQRQDGSPLSRGRRDWDAAAN